MTWFSAILGSLLAMQSAQAVSIGHSRLHLDDYHRMLARASRGKHRAVGPPGAPGDKLAKRFAKEHKPRGY